MKDPQLHAFASLVLLHFRNLFALYSAPTCKRAIPGLPLNETTLADQFKKAGYATAAMGKVFAACPLQLHRLHYRAGGKREGDEKGGGGRSAEREGGREGRDEEKEGREKEMKRHTSNRSLVLARTPLFQLSYVRRLRSPFFSRPSYIPLSLNVVLSHKLFLSSHPSPTRRIQVALGSALHVPASSARF